jgi:hypothetical protein
LEFDSKGAVKPDWSFTPPSTHLAAHTPTHDLDELRSRISDRLYDLKMAYLGDEDATEMVEAYGLYHTFILCFPGIICT